MQASLHAHLSCIRRHSFVCQRVLLERRRRSAKHLKPCAMRRHGAYARQCCSGLCSPPSSISHVGKCARGVGFQQLWQPRHVGAASVVL